MSICRPQYYDLHAGIFSTHAMLGHHVIDSSQMCNVVNSLAQGDFNSILGR